MAAPVLIITAIESSLGFLMTSAILYLVLRRGRKAYHYIFAAFLLICALWDLGTFLMVIRNGYPQELEVIGRIAITPCIFISALIFHFANLYTGRPIKWAIGLVWGMTGLTFVLILLGVFYQIEGVYSYSWGNIFRVVPTFFDPLMFVFWFGINLPACWLLLRGYRKATTRLQRRHYLYIISGFLAITLAIVKALVTMGIDVSFVLPLGMFLNDLFSVIIGLAIIKERLFDITVVVKKGTLYSILAAILIFVFSFCEHIILTYFGKMIAGHSEIVHILSIAVGIAVLMPLKHRIEGAIESYFAQKKVEF